MAYAGYCNIDFNNGKPFCKIHGKSHITTGIPFELTTTHCMKCIDDAYNNAAVCPHCGTRQGFAMGTGDCGCEVDY